MVRHIFCSVVANTLLLLVPLRPSSAARVDIASSVRLAHETYERLVAAPHIAAIAEEDEQKQDNKHSVEETNADATSSSPTSGEGAPSAQQNMPDEGDKNLAYDGAELIDWINNNGGFIHPNARIGLDPTGQYRGVFVKSVGEEGGTSEGLEEGDIVGRIPW